MTSRSHGGIVDRIKRLPWWLAPVVAAAVAVAFIAFGAIFTSESGDLWFELGKAGVQLLAIVVLGSAVAAAFRVLDDRREGRRIGASEQREEDRKLAAERREERRLLDEYRAGIAAELVDAYHRIKAVRRTLRAIGFGPTASGTLSTEQRTDFRRQMELLNDAQLTLEKVKRDVEGQPPVFEHLGQPIWEKVDRAERYVNQVIGDWEDPGTKVEVDADLSSIMASLGNLRSFLLSAGDDEGLKQNVSEPILEAARLIHSLRLRVSPAELGVPTEAAKRGDR
jgi:hypothetical protein